MKNNFIYLVLAFLNIWSYNAYSQINCTVPLPPELTSVSVQPETELTELNWTQSPSSDIAAYILYTYNNGDGMAFDTVWDPTATHHSFLNASTKYFSVSYVVAAYRLPVIPGMDGCPSPLSNALNTIFVKAEIDTCNYRIALTWNSYQSVPKKVIDYSILLSVNGGSFTEAGKVSALTNNFVLTDFTTYTQYSFIIRANLEDGTISTSNKTSLTTRLPTPPLWINADYATVNPDNKISLSFTIDPTAEITHFILERKSGKEEIFQEIAQPVSVNGSVTITDDQADVGIINFYRLSAINSCKNPVIVSNLCSNIVLSLERPDNNLSFSWNPYKHWLGMISSYRLFMDSGQGYIEKMVIQPTDSVLTLEYQSIMYQVTGNEVCFYIDASEAANPYGVSGHSNSSVICTLPTVNITVPNVFTPNNDLVNDFFKPVLTFTPVDYHLIISDRQGNVLFDTRDFNAAWDGSRNGIPQPQGVCLWFLKATTPAGMSITRTGTLTIIKDK